MPKLDDMHIRASAVLIWLLWLGGLTLIVLACVVVLRPPFAALGLAFIIFGSTVQVSSWMQELGTRERDAFELGRQSRRMHAID